MSKEIFGVIAVALVVATYIPFIYQIAKNQVRPHPFSWLIWSITSFCIAALQYTNGAGFGAFPSGAVTLFALTVMIMAFKKKRTPIKLVDIFCLVLALIGVLFWIVIQQPLISMLLLLSVDVIGFIPTLRKGWGVPYEDSLTMWGATLARHTVSIFAIVNYSIITLLNPVVWIALASSMCLMLSLRRRHFDKQKGRKRIFRPHV